MNQEELLKYEMPTIAEYVSIGWMQTVIAFFLARKINRKMRRYEERIAREEYVKSVFNKSGKYTKK